MAATFKSLVEILLRKAAYEESNSNTNAQTFLQTLVLSSYTNTVATQGGQIVSVSVNGKSTTLQIPQGSWNTADIASAAETALQLLEAGLSRVPVHVRPVFT